MITEKAMLNMGENAKRIGPVVHRRAGEIYCCFFENFCDDRWDCRCCFEDIIHAMTVIHWDQNKSTAAK